MAELPQWLSLTEHDILLHKGLSRATGLIPVPSGIVFCSEEDRELPNFDGQTPAQLADAIDSFCCKHGASFSNLMEYRLNALKGLWKARKVQLARPDGGSSAEQHSSLSVASSRLGALEPADAPKSFASVVGLILVFPILRSLGRIDPSLSSDTAQVLLHQLRTYRPFSLSTEPMECITGVEQLLVSWLHSATDDQQLQNTASALVSLAVAQGSPLLILHTVHELQSFQSRNLQLLVPSVLSTLLESHVARLHPSPLAATHHRSCWEHDNEEDDKVPESDKDTTTNAVPSIATDGCFLYILKSSGVLVKIGTGEMGTLRGYC